MLNRPGGEGQGTSQLPREAKALSLRWPKEPLSGRAGWGGGVTSSFVSPSKGWPHHPPGLKPRALGLVPDTPLLPPRLSWTPRLFFFLSFSFFFFFFFFNGAILVCLKRSLVIQEFPNSGSLPCSRANLHLRGGSSSRRRPRIKYRLQNMASETQSGCCSVPTCLPSVVPV